MIYLKEMDGKVYTAINIQRENITLLMVRDNRQCQIKIALRNTELENSSYAQLRLQGNEIENIVSYYKPAFRWSFSLFKV